MTYDRAATDRLLFRRQFVLGPRAVDQFPGWQRFALDRGLHLTVHPDLAVTRAARDGRSLALLGYALDPARPLAGDADVVAALLDRMVAGEDVLHATASLGGRWILIANDGTRSILFADAGGLRQAAYARGVKPGEVWCASQAGLLAEVFGAPRDPEAAAFLAAVEPGRHAGMVWFPGDTTPFAGIRALLPNHVLDLSSGDAKRWWPVADLPVTTRRAAIAVGARTLGALSAAAGNRFPLMLAMTAGWDSRMALASTHAMAGRLFYYSLLFGDKPRDDPDVTTPTRLMARLGLEHVIIDRKASVDPGFAAVYRRNIVPGYEPNCAAVQALLEDTPAGGVIVSGDSGEIPRFDHALRRLDAAGVTPRDLADASRLPAHPFVLRAFGEWLDGARDARRNVSLRHLFGWEQEAGRLQAMLLAELDVARDAFAPMNCRSLLETLLSVPVRYREEPTYYLFRGLIRRMWPETLVEPINARPQVGAEAALRRALDGMRLVRLVPRPVKQMAKRVLGWAGSATSLER